MISPRGAGRRLRPLVVLCAAVWMPCGHAALSENLGTSMTAMSLGNAVTADPPGIDSINFNPAGLARLDGDRYSISGFAAKLRGFATFHQPEGYDIGGWKNDPLDGTQAGPYRMAIYIPGVGINKARLPAAGAGAAGVSFNKPGSPWTFATAFYATQFLGYNRTTMPNDPTNWDGKLVSIQRLVYFSPSVAYKVSDSFMVGVAVPVANQAMYMSMDMRMPNVLLGIVGKLQEGFCPKGGSNPLDTLTFGLCGGGDEGHITPYKKMAGLTLDATAPVDITANIGALWSPAPWISLGAVYRSGSKTVVRGTYALEAEPVVRAFASGLYKSLFGPVVAAIAGIPADIPPVQTGYVQVTVPFPSHLQLGVAIRPIPSLQFNIDVNRADWGEWDVLKVKFDQNVKLLELARIFGVTDPSALNLPRGYKTVWHPGFGLQWQATPRLALRLGYEPRKSSIPADKIDLIAPLAQLNIKSVGARWQIDKDSDINFNLSFMKTSFTAPANTSCNLNCTNFFNVIYNPYAGLDVSGGMRIIMGGFTLNKRF